MQKEEEKKTGINPHTEPYITLKKRWEKWYANIVINNTYWGNKRSSYGTRVNKIGKYQFQ